MPALNQRGGRSCAVVGIVAIDPESHVREIMGERLADIYLDERDFGYEDSELL